MENCPNFDFAVKVNLRLRKCSELEKVSPQGKAFSGYSGLVGFSSNRVASLSATTLLEGSDGAIYGGQFPTGNNWQGSLFRFDPAGGDLHILHLFATNNYPAKMFEGSDRLLYGTADNTLYRIDKDGAHFSVLSEVEEDTILALFEGHDGRLYFSTQFRILCINKDGTDFRILHDFRRTNSPPALEPTKSLVESSARKIYGSAWTGIYEMNTDGSDYRVFVSGSSLGFGRANIGFVSPHSALVIGTNGALYGATTTLACICEGQREAVYRLWLDGRPDIFALKLWPDEWVYLTLLVQEGSTARLSVSADLKDWSGARDFQSNTNFPAPIDLDQHPHRFYRLERLSVGYGDKGGRTATRRE